MTRIAIGLLVMLLAGAQTPQEDAVKKDLKGFQGTWVIAALEVNGKEVAVDKLEGTSVTVKGDRYTVKIKDKVFPMRIKLDPSKDPREIDMIPTEGDKKDQVHRGIYKLENDTFKICRGLNPDQDRPNQFATWPNTNYFVVTWKRAP
jgi:uncharacterized protein (TIGR03067 family)